MEDVSRHKDVGSVETTPVKSDDLCNIFAMWNYPHGTPLCLDPRFGVFPIEDTVTRGSECRNWGGTYKNPFQNIEVASATPSVSGTAHRV